jgi:hypothetical protein
MRIHDVAAGGAPLGSEQDALDLIGETYGREIDLVAIPVTRLVPGFFRLRNGMAGAFIQKFVNYGLRVAFVGDLSAQMAESTPLADFVRESNRRSIEVRFVAVRSHLG